MNKLWCWLFSHKFILFELRDGNPAMFCMRCGSVRRIKDFKAEDLMRISEAE